VSFPAYPSYRDSGVEWLGDVPSHWVPARLRFLVQLNPSKSEVSGLDSDAEVSFVPMEAVGEQGELSLDRTRPISEVLTGYTYFREGDVSIAKITPCFENGKGAIMRNLVGGVGFGTTELIVARPRQDRTTPEFIDWLFRSPAFRSRGEAAMYGAGGQKRVPDDFVRDFISPGPPLAEQVAIAAFLDRETAKIDALIEEQRRLIALLKEKRQAVISKAVTKGLDPHAPMKDSGIEWLGEVPAHWEVKPVKALAALAGRIGFRGYTTADLVAEGEGAITLSPSNIVSGEISYQKCTYISWAKFEESPEIIVEPKDIVLVKTGSTFGRVGYFGTEDVPAATINPQLLLLKRVKCDPEFLFHALNAPHVQALIRVSNTGGTIPTMTQEFVGNLDIPVPPEDEQRSVLQALGDRTAGFRNLIASAESALVLLSERRAALISAAVTGKIDVRGSARVLPFPIDRARARGLIATEIIERSAHQATFGRVKFQKIAFLTEAHVGVSELAGSYTREAAGPLDRALIDEMESGARSIAGIEREQPGGAGTTVSYRLGEQRGAHRQELAQCLGADRTAKLDKLIGDFAALSTKEAEAVATLYGVWNDALSEGASPTDEEIISGFLNDWHPEKRAKFRASELPEWLGWMRRHGIVPTGSGPKTTTGRLFV
jgi:type I restriction enzyme S subunit